MAIGVASSFGAQLRALREAAGYTQEELAAVSGLSVHAISALERGERRRPHVDTVRALCAALDLTGSARDRLVASSRAPAQRAAADEIGGVPPPVPLTTIIGRDQELQTLRQWLSDPAVRLVTLVGPGGVGKTRLAVEAARLIADGNTTRVVFAPLAAIRDPGLAACAIAEALGLADITASELPRRARAACMACPTLVLVDNVEQVIDAATVIADLLTTATTLQLLVTSRAPLRIRGEREYAVGPLPLAQGVESLPPADLAQVPAVRLFIERAREVRPEFRLTARDRRALVGICRRLDGLPLALELTARWMKVLSIEDLHDRLERDVLLPSDGPRDLPERQQTLEATIAWSYNLITPEAQRAFRRLSVLPARFPPAAAAAVIDIPADVESDAATVGALAELVDRSLLLRVEAELSTRALFQMLGTVRAFAARELAATGESENAIEGVVRYCTDEAGQAGQALLGPVQSEWLNRVHADLDSYRTALTFLLERGRADEACDIAAGLLTFWFIRGYSAEGLWWYQETLKQPSLTSVAESRALFATAIMWYAQQRLESARPPVTRALELARQHGDVILTAMAEFLLGHLECSAGHPETARKYFSQSLMRFRELRVPWGIGSALSGLAIVHLSTGEPERAEPLFDEATSALRRAGPWYLSLVLSIRARLAVQRGSLDEAIGFVHEALTRIREVHDTFAVVQALVPLAAAAILKGDHAFAARVLGSRDAIAERAGVALVDPAVRELREQAERDARERLGPDRWSLAYAAGRTSSIDALLGDADRILKTTQHQDLST